MPIRQLDDLPLDAPETVYDVCIIGTGPAGMTLLGELADSGQRICVLESGSQKKSAFADALRVTKSTGEIVIKEPSRERVLGGASTTWPGLSAPMDPIDLSYRPFVQAEAWPIQRPELDRYYQIAGEKYGFPPIHMFTTNGLEEMKRAGETVFTFDQLEEKEFAASDPAWNFGKKLVHLFDQKNVDLILNATVLNIASTRINDAVDATHARVQSPNGTRRDFRARRFVLATGGIENARLLLNSRDTNPTGLGNEHDQVGRYLMNHPKNNYGVIHLTKPVRRLPYLFGCLHKGYAGFIGLRLTEAYQRTHQVLNSYVRFEPVFPWTDNPGVWSLIMIAKRTHVLLNSWKRAQQHRVVELRDYAETGDEKKQDAHTDQVFHWIDALRHVFLNFPVVCSYVFSRLRKQHAPLIHTVRLRNFMEMEPVPENRITLGTDVDANGQPIPVVHLSTTPRDRESLIELHRVLGEELARQQIGTLESDLATAQPWPINFDASHHIGATRMGTDPMTSVVDKNLRVHSVQNLFVVGASVFPTSGNANPTYTISALAIRLAEHLRASND